MKSMDTINSNKKELSPEQSEELLVLLKARFEKNMSRHQNQVGFLSNNDVQYPGPIP